MKKKMILLIWLTSISFIGFSQDFRKVGLGIGYHTTSIVGDSVRPFELSLRYRIDNKHTLQVYAPLWLKKEEQKLKDAKPNFMKQEDYDMYNHTWSRSLWGIGVGYDYAFFSYSLLDFFAGVSADFQWYEYREDSHYMYYGLIQGVVDRPLVYEDFYKEERLSYYWDRIKGVSVIPNMGIRFITPKLTVEGKINLNMSQLNKKAYYSSETKAWYSSTTWESFYPEKNKQELSIRPNISINLSYYF